MRERRPPAGSGRANPRRIVTQGRSGNPGRRVELEYSARVAKFAPCRVIIQGVTNPTPLPDNVDPAHLAHVQENFVRHMLPLRGFVLSLIPRRHVADDVVQDTFLTVCARAGSYRRDTNYRAWLFTIARFKVLAALKREAGRGGLLDPHLAELLVDEPVEARVAEVPERLAALDACVNKLARMARRAVELRYRDGLGPTDVAGRLGWQVNALNVALSRARAFLRRCVEESLRTARTCGP